MDLALVSCVEDFPLIYDKAHKLYKDGAARKNSFASITEILNLQLKATNTQDFYEKRWLQLRKRFTEVRRKMIQTPSGSGASTYQWPIYGAIQFLDAHTPKRIKLTAGNVPMPEASQPSCSRESQETDIILEDSTDEWVDEEIIIQEEDSDNVDNIPVLESRATSRQSTSEGSKESTPVSRKRKMFADPLLPAVEGGMKALESYLNLRKKEMAQNKSIDVDTAVAQGIAVKLQQIKNPRRKNRVHRQIMNLICDAIDSEEEDQ